MMRFDLSISEDLNAKISEVAQETGKDHSQILRRALLLYFAANEGVKAGKKVGLVDAETNLLQTEIVGL